MDSEHDLKTNVLSPVLNPARIDQMVFEALRDAIVRKELRPGSRLSEAQLAQQLGVSKTPVREGLLRLEVLGLVVPNGQRGKRVVQPASATIEYAFDVRALLEGFASRRAAEFAKQETRDEIRQSAQRSLECALAEDKPGFRDADREFHSRIAAASGNSVLERMTQDVYTLAWALRTRDVQTTVGRVECANEHLAIAAAIADGDAEGAEAQMVAHVDAARKHVLAASGDLQDPGPPQ